MAQTPARSAHLWPKHQPDQPIYGPNISKISPSMAQTSARSAHLWPKHQPDQPIYGPNINQISPSMAQTSARSAHLWPRHQPDQPIYGPNMPGLHQICRFLMIRLKQAIGTKSIFHGRSTHTHSAPCWMEINVWLHLHVWTECVHR